MLARDIEMFIEHCGLKGLSTKTINSYEQTLRLFMQYMDEQGILLTEKITHLAIQGYIEKERDEVLRLSRGISAHLRAANTISPVNMSEFEERRLQLDKALECCNVLQDELNYIAKVLPADKNKYTRIVLKLEKDFNLIKKLRQSDNGRFLPHIQTAAKTE